MPELAEVFQRYGGAYLDQFGADLLPSHRRAIEDILHCRTEVLGGHLLRCDHCGQEHYVYHSCRNRSCPKCHRQDTESWMQEQRQELLPVPYFHVVFTVPHELGELIRRHQQDLYDILLRAAARSLMKLAADPHYVGGLIGVRFLALIHQERPDLTLPESVRTKGWVVYCKPTVQGTEQVLTYLGRYLHRIALTNSRILSSEDGHVCFRYQDGQNQRWKTMKLPAHEFIRRFLQHVLPQGFHKVRYYGLWSPIHRPLLHQLQLVLAGHAPEPPPTAPARTSQPTDGWCPPLRAGQPCPHCGQGLLVVIRSLPRHPRGPP